MCLIGFAFDPQADQPLLLAANRDEFLDRPTQIASWWSDAPQIYGGRDLQAGGTWMAVSRPEFNASGLRTCRFAALTNYRDGQSALPGQRSRGELVSRLLGNAEPVPESMHRMSRQGADYAGFNLLGFEWREANTGRTVSGFRGWHLSNRGELTGSVHEVPAGIHGVSNGQFNEPWPKTRALTRTLGALDPLGPAAENRELLLQCLCSQTPVPDDALPHTGLPTQAERDLACLFIRTRLDSQSGQFSYGTRSSALISVRNDGRFSFEQWTWQPDSPGPTVQAYRRMSSSPGR